MRATRARTTAKGSGPSRRSASRCSREDRRHMPLPLEGMRVLDLTNVMAGPYCSMVLGDLGAEVVKVESFEGDSTRKFEPLINGESYCFAVLNRNKKSLSVDMKSP